METILDFERKGKVMGVKRRKSEAMLRTAGQRKGKVVICNAKEKQCAEERCNGKAMNCSDMEWRCGAQT